MTRIELLKCLKGFTETATGDIILPVRQQEEDEEPSAPRAAEVHIMRLPDSSAAKKKAPYIIHQVITGKDIRPPGDKMTSNAVVRSIFCVYNENEREGSLALLGLIERQRIGLLKQVVIGKQFQLDLMAGVETLIYPDDTAPYYAGEMISAWIIPGIEREVDFYGEKTKG